MISSARIYIMIITKESQRFFTYKGNIFAGAISAVFTLVVRYALWSALFATGNAGDVTLREILTYFVIIDILRVWLEANYGDAIGADIRSGDIVGRLVRPCSYHLQLVATFHARAVCDTITRALPMLIIAVIFIGLMPPVSAVATAVFILSVLLGALIYSLISMIISYMAFWTIASWQLQWYIIGLFMLFGGVALPLWFYPEWLRMLSGVLPFQFALFQPLGIYLGRVPPNQFAFTIGAQLFWIAVLFLLERVIWRRAQYKLVVQGG